MIEGTIVQFLLKNVCGGKKLFYGDIAITDKKIKGKKNTQSENSELHW